MSLLGFCPTIVKIELKTILYFTRLINMDRVGVEPTTSVQTIVVKIKVQSYSKVVVGIANGLRKKFGNVVNIAPITLLLSEQETKNDVSTRTNFCL
jgi:hypothetical protein